MKLKEGGIDVLGKLEIVLQNNAKTYMNHNISSLLQGVLMEQITREYGEVLHKSQLQPYSQQVMVTKDTIKWRVFTLSKVAHDEIINPLMKNEFTTVHLKHKDMQFEVIGKNSSEYSYDQLIENAFFATCPRVVEIEFVTPTAFKSNNEYIIFPTAKHIFQSLMLKFDAHSSDSEIFSMELLEDIEKYVKIIGYQLHTTKFHLEGISIPAFQGKITLKITGPQQLVNMVQMLLQYGEYSGVGIKCAIGMGGIQIKERGRKPNER